MRFRVNRIGDKRTRRWFAVIPVVVDFEARWFEFVHAEQEYRYQFGGTHGWKTIRFLN